MSIAKRQPGTLYIHPSIRSTAPTRRSHTHTHTHPYPQYSGSSGSNTTLSNSGFNSSSKEAKSLTANRVRHQSPVQLHSLGTSFFPVPRHPGQCAERERNLSYGPLKRCHVHVDHRVASDQQNILSVPIVTENFERNFEFVTPTTKLRFLLKRCLFLPLKAIFLAIGESNPG